eukprot:scaffold530_cov107-Cylindrotheca_fusiformis.AAC.2
MESSEIEEVNPRYFVYTNDTTKDDIPRRTLTHLRVDSSVREIPSEAFKSCTALVQVHLPETLTRIGESAFLHCYDLKCIQFVSDGTVESPSINDNLEDGLIVFPERATKLQIDDWAFVDCYSLRKVIICSVSTELGAGVFTACLGLVSVELPEGLQVIEDVSFYNCESLATVKIPSSVIRIGQEAFCECPRLSCVDLPHGLLEIYCSSFRKCRSIETICIPSTVFSVEESAFRDCCWLKSIKLPPTLEIIEARTFRNTGLVYINLPSTLKTIHHGAFENCSSLSHIRIPPSVHSIVCDAFIGCRRLISIELPEGTLFFIDLEGCYSLVNMAVPIRLRSNHFTTFMERSKLARVFGGYNLGDRFKHRFDDSPLNKLCYYQSYYSSGDAMAQLRSLMDQDPLAAVTQVDGFGMTPLHILSLSQSPNLDMLVAVMEGGHPDHMIHGRDSFGSTPMDYLCLNRNPDSNQVIRRVLQMRFDHSLGSDGSGKLLNTIWKALEEALAAEWSSRRKEIVVVYFKLLNYERTKKVLSLVELSLWKAKIDEVSSENAQIADRESCRINSGASIVIPHLIPFLDKLDVEDYLSRFP